MECSICHETCFQGLDHKATKCKHEFHWTCLREWLDTKDECPNCRFASPCDYTPKPKPMDDFMVMVLVARFRQSQPTARKSEADKAADPENYILNPATGRYVKRS